MKTRTTAVLAVCVAAGLVASLLLFRRSGPDAPPSTSDTPAAGTNVRVGVGISDHEAERGWFLMASEDVARELFDVNFWGAVNVSREAVRFFREVNNPQGGLLLQASSAGGIESLSALPYYCASKHGGLPARMIVRVA